MSLLLAVLLRSSWPFSFSSAIMRSTFLRIAGTYSSDVSTASTAPSAQHQPKMAPNWALEPSSSAGASLSLRSRDLAPLTTMKRELTTMAVKTKTWGGGAGGG